MLLLVVTCVTLGATLPAYAREGDADEAVAAFNRGQDIHEKGDLKGAVLEYEKALKQMPAFPEAEYQRAMAEIGLGNLAEAELSLRRATELRPEWSLAWGMLGDILVRRYFAAPAADRASLRAGSQAALDRALELDAGSVPAITALAELQIRSGAAKDELTATLVKLRSLTDGKMSPAPALWSARAWIEAHLGDAKSAKSSVARALELDPRSTGALFLAADLATADDLDRAKQLANRLSDLKADPTRLALLNARIAAAEERYADAKAILDRVASDPDAIKLRGEIDAASTVDPAALEKLLATEPDSTRIVKSLCSLYRREQPAKALGYCKRASDLEPTNIEPAIGYAAALVQARQFPAAQALLQRLLHSAPDNSTLHANLATALFEMKQYPAARKEFDWLASANPAAPTPYFFLGILHDQMEEYVDAQAAYEQYLRLADPVTNKLDIEKVELRLPAIRRLVKDGKGRKVRS